jgi:4-hydroxybenzoate polyprenyltransferase
MPDALKRLTKFDLYVLVGIWGVVTLGGWAIAGADLYWTLQQPSPTVISEPPLVLQGCTSVRRLNTL